MLRDKTGKELAVGQLVDIPVHLVPLATGLIIDCKHAPMEIPGQGLLPACVTIQVTMTIPAGRDGGVWCYVVKDAPVEALANKPNDDGEGDGDGEKVDVVRPFKVQ